MNLDAKHTLVMCEDFMNKQHRFFTPHNIDCLRILDKLFDASIDCAYWNKAVEYGAQTVDSYR